MYFWDTSDLLRPFWCHQKIQKWTKKKKSTPGVDWPVVWMAHSSIGPGLALDRRQWYGRPLRHAVVCQLPRSGCRWQVQQGLLGQVGGLDLSKKWSIDHGKKARWKHVKTTCPKKHPLCCHDFPCFSPSFLQKSNTRLNTRGVHPS